MVRGNSAALARRVGFWTPRRREGLAGWLLIGPSMVYTAIFGLAPLVAVFVLAFTRWNGFVGSPGWVGLSNFRVLWRFSLYREALWHTAVIGGVTLALTSSIGLAMALLLNMRVPGAGVYRTLWYLPTVVSLAIIARMWGAFIDPTTGAFDNLLRVVGKPPVIWSLSTAWMTLHLAVMTTWKGVGNTMVIFLAALQRIDPALYEAARLDGSGRLALFRHITLPSLRPFVAFVLIVGTLGALHIFEPVILLTQGGPFGSTTVIVYRIYEDAFQDNQYGVACATSVIFALLCLGCTMLLLRLFRQPVD